MGVKLIVSDIDGTLIPYGMSGLPEGLFPLIRALRASGILFCPASGRQYHSLRALFAPVADEVGYLCENGAVVFGAGREGEARLLSKTPMPRAEAIALIRTILALPDCEALISGENVSYVLPKAPDFVPTFRAATGNRIRIVGSPDEIEEDIVKVSAYAPVGLDAPKRALGARFAEEFHMAEAGPAWLDFTLADKGVGLRGLCAALGVSAGEIVAFGDNWNDVAMLDAAGESYLMSTASPELRARYPRQCDSVLAVLEEILQNKMQQP